MKAVLIRKHGGSEVLEIADLPKPKADVGQVLLRVMAAGMNHLDTWVRRGMPGVTLPLPMILGSDAAGVIEAAGPGVAGVKPGDRVFVSPGLSCMRCIECCSGREPLCRDYGMLGEHTNGVQAEFVALGADEAINYRTSDFLDETRRITRKRGVDVVIDSIGQETWDRSLRALARGGRLVTCGATSGYQGSTDIRHVFAKGLSILGSTMG